LLNDTSHVRLGGFSFAISLSSEVLDVSLPRQNLVFSAPELLYKAPELQPTGDWKHIDMWAVGCIFARLLGNSYLFSGTTTKGMIESILSVTECRPDPQFKFNNNIPMLTQCLQSNPNPRPLAEKLLSAGPDALDLLKRIFKFEPASRITAEEALQHPYFKDIYKVSPMCAVGHECTDEELLEFIDTYCPTLL
jgi:serine/threonine protein kinase